MQSVSSRARPLLAACLLLCAACAQTPQIIPVLPAPQVNPDPGRGHGRTMSIDVVDGRSSNVIGYRDPTDKNSVMTSAPEAIQRMRAALEQAYKRLGFTIVPVGEKADVVLEARLTEFGYSRAADGLVKNLHTGATLQVTSIMPTKTVDGTYRDGQDKDTVISPSREENADILNRHLSAAMSRLVNDPRLTTE